MDKKNIERDDRGWRMTDGQGRELGQYDRWRDAEEDRIWGHHDDEEADER